MVVTKEQIDRIFEEAQDQGDYIVALYNMVLPNPLSQVKVRGWPRAGRQINEYIMRRAMDFDRTNHKGVLRGGAWMNYGFQSDESLGDWEVSLEGVQIIEEE